MIDGLLYVLTGRDIKYLNNIVEQGHRWVKQKTCQALGWKSM